MKKRRFFIPLGVAMLFLTLGTGLKKQVSVVNQNEAVNEYDSSGMKVAESEGEREKREENNREEQSESKDDEKSKQKPRTLKRLYDNETPYEELITIKYSVEEMEKLKEVIEEYRDRGYGMASVIKYIYDEYPFECAREGMRVNYVLFQGEDGSLLCAFFDKKNNDIYHIERYTEFHSVKDFENFIDPEVTYREEIEDVFGKLFHGYDDPVGLPNRVVKEGTLFFMFSVDLLGKPSTLVDMAIYRDGEEFLDGYDYLMPFIMRAPEMLPMDKHIIRSETERRMEGDPDTLFDLADNETPYEELITKKYSAEDMERIKEIMDSHKGCSILEVLPYVDMDYPIECVRAADRVNYILYQGEDDSLLCVFFSKRTFKICQVDHFYEFYSVEDFEGKLKPMETNKKDIEAAFGKLEGPLLFSSVADRVVKEGTLYFLFDYEWPNGLVFYEMTLFRDGERFPDGYDTEHAFGADEPEMLPIDKHIGKEGGGEAKEKQEGEEGRNETGKSGEKPCLVMNPDGFTSLYNNEAPYEELITQKYSAEELERQKQRLLMSPKQRPLLQHFYRDTVYKYECVREAGRVNYMLFRGKDGSLLCAFFDKRSFFIYQVERFDKFYSVKDFEDRIQPGVTTKEEIESAFGELCYHHNCLGNLANRVVKEGTLFFEFETKYDGRVVLKKMYLFRDGETLPDGYETLPEAAEKVPEILPMDKHIGKEDIKDSGGE